MKVSVDRQVWLRQVAAGCLGPRQGGLVQEHPKEVAVLRGDGLNGGVQGLKGGGDAGPRGGEHDRLMLLGVTVPFDQARLKHPVQQFLETGKVIWRLVSVGWHLLRKAKFHARLKAKAEVAA